MHKLDVVGEKIGIWVGCSGGGGGMEEGERKRERESVEKVRMKTVKKKRTGKNIFIVTDQGNIFFSDINVHPY